MRYLLIVLLLISASANAQQHCGYDFSSYVVLHIHEDGKPANIPNLKVTLVDSLGNDIINTNNQYSWNNSDKVMQFYENYRIDANGKKLEVIPEGEKPRWFFPFAKDAYLLSVTNEFPADAMKVKIEETVPDNQKQFETKVIQLYAYNMYVLCTTQVQQQAQQFGPRVNKPVNVVLERKK